MLSSKLRDFSWVLKDGWNSDWSCGQSYKDVKIVFFPNVFPLITSISLKDGCRKLGDGKRCSLEDFALGVGFAHMLEGPLPAKVLSI